jgi:hypothetical protein
MKHLQLAISVPFLALAPIPAAAQQAAPASAMPPPAPINPERLAAAKITVDHIFPAGTYAKLMNGNINVMLDGIVKNSGLFPLREAAALAGQPPAELAKLGKTTVADIMAILDPAHDQRTSIIMHTTMAAMTDIMSQLEPGIREGLAEAYAAQFSLSQLSDINRFFDTPSGQAYASYALSVRPAPP